MKEPRVAILISSYNQEELVQKNISLLQKTNYKNYRIYLIDDSGKGKIGKIIKKRFPEVKVLINSENLGFSKSYNKGIELAKKDYNPDWFLVLNDDCELRNNNWLKNLLEKTKKYPSGGIFGCKNIYPNGDIQWGVKIKKTYFYKTPGKKEKNREFSEDSETNQIVGAFMFIKKEVFEKIGLFDEGFSPFYGEESDLCFRALKKGYKLFYIGAIELVHHRDASISKIPSERVWYIKKRNSIRLEFKHYGFFKKGYFFFIHFVSLFKKESLPFRVKLKLLLKAYKENLKKFKEIKKFRRFNYK